MPKVRDLFINSPAGESLKCDDSHTHYSSGWDENLGDKHLLKVVSEQKYLVDSSFQNPICHHALAHDCHVLGTKSNILSNESEEWIKWRTSFFPFQVCRVVSNPEGTVIAASISDGTVALLRGTDGKILAIRKVLQTEDKDLAPLIDISFIAGIKHHLADSDALSILVPQKANTNINHKDGNQKANVILASSIDGISLNSKDEFCCAEASRKMSLDTIYLSLPTREAEKPSNLCGCFISNNKIRFFVGDNNGLISVQDYNIVQKTTKLVKGVLNIDKKDEGDKDDSTWLLNSKIGLHFCSVEEDVIMLSAVADKRRKICWLYVKSLELLCDHEISIPESDGTLNILSISPVKSCISIPSIGAAIALKMSKNLPGVIIQIIQAKIEEIKNGDVSQNNQQGILNNDDLSDGTALNEEYSPGAPKRLKRLKMSVSKFHTVYTLNCNPTIEQSSLQMVHMCSNCDDSSPPFNIRYRNLYDSSSIAEYKEFWPDEEGELAGKFRLLLSQGSFDEADILLANTEKIATISDVSFHGSEVALGKFQKLLSTGNISSHENMSKAKQCLRRLAAGAVSGKEFGIRCLLESSNTLRNWSMDSSWGDKESAGVPIQEFRLALSAMSTTISSVIDVVPPSQVSILQDEIKTIKRKINALKCIQKVLKPEENDKIVLAYPLSSVHSPEEFFRILVSKGYLILAERVRQSEWGNTITAENIASSILDITSNLDPRQYTCWLRDAVIPELAVNHPLIEEIRLWACRVADDFDDPDTSINNNFGLESSIQLLQTVCDSTAKLSVNSHASFASFSPFSFENSSIPRNVVQSTSESLNISTESTLSALTIGSESIRYEAPSTQLSVPTIMESLDYCRKTNKETSQSGHLFSISDVDTENKYGKFSSVKHNPNCSSCDSGIQNDCDNVEIKLFQAKILQEARKLCVPQCRVNLKTFEDRGGVANLAKETIRVISAQNLEDESQRRMKICTTVKQFCESAHVSFDEAIADYTRELCNSNKNQSNILTEASTLVRCCDDPLVKCEVALNIIRSALLCEKKPNCLSLLTRDALKWATEEDLRSQLEEASRLLVIDEIVRRYCGNKAQDYFRVENPHHSMRLLDHLCRFIEEPTVLTDIFALCDAFTHLSKVDACTSLFQRMAMAKTQNPKNHRLKQVAKIDDSRSQQCSIFLRKIYTMDSKVACKIGFQFLDFCAEVLTESSDSVSSFINNRESVVTKQQEAVAVSSCACAVIVVMKERNFEKSSEYHDSVSQASIENDRLPFLLQEYQRIIELQLKFGIYLSLSELRKVSHHDAVIKRLFPPIIELFDESVSQIDDSKLRSVLATIRRGCSLLFGEGHNGTASNWCRLIGKILCALIKRNSLTSCIQLLEASDILSEIESGSAFHSVVSVALTLCVRASEQARAIDRYGSFESQSKSILSSMECVVSASSLLQEHAVIFCPQTLLPSIVYLSTLTEVISQILVRADCGSGEIIDKYRQSLQNQWRWKREPLREKIGLNLIAKSSIKFASTTSLQPTWYIGDGILLPPAEVLIHCTNYCKDLLELSSGFGYGAELKSLNGVYEFLDNRGAHTISLRMLACATSVAMSSIKLVNAPSQVLSEHSSKLFHAFQRLAERSLGGSGNGIISGVIDSQLAVSHLLSLPIKVAFKTYKASLPVAISKRDFSRVQTIANVGFRAGGGCALNYIGSNQIQKTSFAWKKQENFVSQCRKLSKKAYWWDKLKTFGVKFDPRLFDDHEQIISKRKINSNGSSKKRIVIPESENYIKSLLPQIVKGASGSIFCPMKVLSFLVRFVKAFNLDIKLAPQALIEFLLSWPGYLQQSKYTLNPKRDFRRLSNVDVRYFVKTCESNVRKILEMLPSTSGRLKIFRKCLINLENVDESGKDYARYRLVLSLYHRELSTLISQQEKENNISIERYVEEHERISRRCEALDILGAFFTEDKMQERPLLQKLFLPISKSFESDHNGKMPIMCGVLGDNSSSSDNIFDPLKHLEPCLSNDPTFSTAIALAPLCNALGIPPGYVHARSLYLRFKNSKRAGASLPPFDSFVRPVINRLKSNNDRAELMEWCASQYDNDSKERLKSLQIALELAIGASNDIERKTHDMAPNTNNSTIADKARKALDTVKRISAETSALSDQIQVQELFEQKNNDELNTASSQVRTILKSLISRVQSKHTGEPYMSPENFIEGLLVEGSLMASESILDEKLGFKMNHFRFVSETIHEACKSLAEQYSHINIGKSTQKLVRRWLTHGDEFNSSSNHKQPENNRKFYSNPLEDTNFDQSLNLDEEDTANFSMDLNAIALGQGIWPDDIGSEVDSKEKISTVTLDEEPSALEIRSNTREISEYVHARVGLRIAFVMSFSEGFHCQKQPTKDENKENINYNVKKQFIPEIHAKGQISRLKESKGEPSKNVMKHAKFLLDIVFGKNNSVAWNPNKSFSTDSKNSDRTFCQSTNSIIGASYYNKIAEKKMTLTFTMRHRALRAVSVLCPQNILDLVVEKEGYFEGETFALAKCCFGSFMAMEIEQMGLPLPHSNIVQLSSMHYPSYARALWRSHGNSECKGFKGRLLFLLLQLSLEDDSEITDPSLVISICKLIRQLKLPRTLLCACETLMRSKQFENLMKANEGEVLDMFIDMVTKSAKYILGELRETIEEICNQSLFAAALHRLCKIVAQLPERDSNQKLSLHVVESICKLVCQRSEKCHDDYCSFVSSALLQEAIYLSSSIRKVEYRDRAISKIARTTGGPLHLHNAFAIQGPSHDNLDMVGDAKSCNELLRKANSYLNSSIDDVLSKIDKKKHVSKGP